MHVDEYNVETYEHTTLLYLSDHGLVISRAAASSSTTATAWTATSSRPRGRSSASAATPTNLHAVEKVSSGCRFALTALFHESSDPGPLFEAGGGGGDPYASWDALLQSAAETSLMAQDQRRRELTGRRVVDARRGAPRDGPARRLVRRARGL